jgi:hypothetical protein
MSWFWMLRAKMVYVYVKRVRIRKEVRRYSLISLRKCSARGTLSANTTRACIDVSRLARLCLRLALVSVSFCAKRRAVSHKHFHSSVWRWTLSVLLCLDDCMVYAAQGETAQQHPECVQLKSRVGFCERASRLGAYLRFIASPWALL